MLFQGYVLLLVELTLLATFQAYSNQRDSELNSKERVPVGVVFPGVNYGNFDTGLFNLFKYLINFAFFKFGVEVREWMRIAQGVCSSLSPVHVYRGLTAYLRYMCTGDLQSISGTCVQGTYSLSPVYVYRGLTAYLRYMCTGDLHALPVCYLLWPRV